MENRKIGIASDHAGYNMKELVVELLHQLGYKVEDFGCHSNERCDYPDYVHPLAESIENGEFSMGIALCGSGNGVNMTLNKHQAIRSALCWNTEIAALARQHNDANVCAIPARFLNKEEVINIVETFINEKFEGGRHIGRINKIPVGHK